MIIGISGYGYTGSGAVYDYLKEREECDTVDVEFCISYLPHGLQDLDFHLNEGISRYYSSDAAIKDFIQLVNKLDTPRSAYRRAMGDKFKKASMEFVENITQLKWNGWWSYDGLRNGFFYNTWRFRILGRIASFYEKRFKKKFKLPENEYMYLSVKPEKFNEEAKKYINTLLDGFGCDRSKVAVVNQPFEGNAPERSMKYFEDSKAIIVDRDPRDVYLFAKNVALGSATFIPTDSVKDFIEYYRLCRITEQPKNPDRVLYMSFEDMIYDYENTVERIDAFIGLEHKEPQKKYFNPDASVNNTQLFLRYPQYADDIKLIENELSEYLYPFEKYERDLGNGEPFKCESD